MKKLNIKNKLNGITSVLIVSIFCFGFLSGGLVFASPPDTAPDTIINDEELTSYKVNGIRYANPANPLSIQDAIDDLHLNCNGGLVIIPGGDYNMPNGSWIILHSNIALVGVGYDTHLTWASPRNFFAITFNSGMDHGLVKDIWVTGFGKSHGIAATAFGAVQVSNCTIQHVKMNGWSDDAMVLARSKYMKVLDCDIYETHEGLEFSACSYSVMRDNRVLNTVQECLELRSYLNAAGNDYYCQNIEISDNILDNWDQSDNGIWLYGNLSNIQIIGNHISNSAAGIYASPVYGTTTQKITNVMILNNFINKAVQGITLSTGTSKDIKIDSNAIIGCTIGIYITQPHENITIESNYVKWCNGTSGYAIRNVAIIKNISVIGNTFVSIGKYGIHLGSCQPLISSNSFYSTGETAIMCYSYNATIIGNSINGATVCGVYIPSPYKNITIVGNRFTNTPYGARSFTNADYVFFIGNNCKGCTSGVTLLVGVNNDVSHNTGI